MKVLLYLSVFYGFFVYAGDCRRRFEHRARGVDFGHDRDWELDARGLLSHIVNLDTLPDVRVAENKGQVIVHLRDTSITSGWQQGWYIIATNVRQRQGSKVNRISIVKKIWRIEIVSSAKIIIHGEDVSALDLITEARLRLKYPHAATRHPRQKRYVSNLLSKVLDKINFNATEKDEVISFNYDNITGHSAQEFTVYKEPGHRDVKLSKVKKGHTATIPDDANFILRCTDCFEVRTIDQLIDLEIERNKSAHLKQFLLQNEVDVTINMDFEIEFKKALGVQERIIIDSSPTTVLRRMPVAVVDEKMPPIQLVVTYNKTVYLDIDATTGGPLTYHGQFYMTGKYTSTSTESSEHVPKTEVTTVGWRGFGTASTSNSSMPYNMTVILYQEVTMKTSIEWSQHDVSLVFAPPEVVKFMPLLYAKTAQDSIGRCENSELSAYGIFRYDKSDFVAKTFHKIITDIHLIEKNDFNKFLTKVILANNCTAKCFGPAPDFSGKTMDDVCGVPVNKTVRGDKDFHTLTMVDGGYILFLSEERKHSTWCGKPGRSCRECVWKDNGDKNDECADRLMTSEAASKLTTLGEFVAKEWPKRKLVVIEAWDEPTSQNPQGNHGVTSLHYTGRALQAALSEKNPSSPLKLETTPVLLSRLAELANCAGFPFAKSAPTYVQLCVGKVTTSSINRPGPAQGWPNSNWGKEDFLKIMEKIGSGVEPIICKPSHIQQGTVHPPGLSRDAVINPIVDELDIQNRLMQYPYDDIFFEPEGSANETCYKPTRRCKSTCTISNSMELWDWCQTRVMTPRMALRLRRLATIVKEKHKGEMVLVSKPSLRHHNKTKESVEEELEKHGRKLRIDRRSNSAMKSSELRAYAVCAGFDYIDQPQSSFIDVYVKIQDGYQTTVVPFQRTTLLAVSVDDKDVDYPPELMGETRMAYLFDGFNETIRLSQHFQISDFKHPDGRFFRLEPALVDCLELVATELVEDSVEVLSAYRNHSVNSLDIDHRHGEERLRFETGQAVYLTTVSKQPDDLMSLAQTILRMCTPVLRLQSRALGIGCHSDKVYIDIRPMTSVDILDFAEIWNVDNSHLFENISKSMNELRLGGPVIFPLNLKRTCKDPRLGHKYAYYSFNTHELGFCFHDHESKFCRNTLEQRTEQAIKLRDQFIKVAGTTLTRGDIEKDLNTCVLKVCGGCPGKGPTWDAKVAGCVNMLHTFLDKARNPFKDVVDRAAFFNTDNPDSSVHSLACHDESKCVEDTQIYSLLMPLLSSKYKPHPDRSQEELLYSGEDNPSPLISLVEQEFARQVAGIVKIYIESETDMAILRDVIKVLMIYNPEVTDVQFHLTEDVDEDNVISGLQRKLEHWAGTTCPMWSRFAVAPFSVHVIPHHRKKRSLERSKHRNDVKRAIKEWELDWIKNM